METQKWPKAADSPLIDLEMLLVKTMLHSFSEFLSQMHWYCKGTEGFSVYKKNLHAEVPALDISYRLSPVY